jgi:hypothetical protein
VQKKEKKIYLGIAAGVAAAIFVLELPELVRYYRMTRL